MEEEEGTFVKGELDIYPYGVDEIAVLEFKCLCGQYFIAGRYDNDAKCKHCGRLYHIEIRATLVQGEGA